MILLLNFHFAAITLWYERRWIKDVDVEVWLHYWAYNKHPPLCGDCDFIIVNTELHNEFDDFKSKELQPGYS